MMQSIKYLLVGLLAFTTACNESEVFYTAKYPVTNEEAVVVLEATTPDEEGSEEGGEDALIAEIRAAVLATAPVKVGGTYVLDFIKHNGGVLVVQPTAEGEAIQGTFVKIPGISVIQFIYGALDYSCTLAAYTDTDGIHKAVLTQDLTEEYKLLYPTANITQVARRAYTSSPNIQ